MTGVVLGADSGIRTIKIYSLSDRYVFPTGVQAHISLPLMDLDGHAIDKQPFHLVGVNPNDPA